MLNSTQSMRYQEASSASTSSRQRRIWQDRLFFRIPSVGLETEWIRECWPFEWIPLCLPSLRYWSRARCSTLRLMRPTDSCETIAKCCYYLEFNKCWSSMRITIGPLIRMSCLYMNQTVYAAHEYHRTDFRSSWYQGTAHLFIMQQINKRHAWVSS